MGNKDNQRKRLAGERWRDPLPVGMEAEVMENLPKKLGRPSRAEKLGKIAEEARLSRLEEERDRSSMVEVAKTKERQALKPTKTSIEALEYTRPATAAEKMKFEARQKVEDETWFDLYMRKPSKGKNDKKSREDPLIGTKTTLRQSRTKTRVSVWKGTTWDIQAFFDSWVSISSVILFQKDPSRESELILSTSNYNC